MTGEVPLGGYARTRVSSFCLPVDAGVPPAPIVNWGVVEMSFLVEICSLPSHSIDGRRRDGISLYLAILCLTLCPVSLCPAFNGHTLTDHTC